MPHWGLFFVTLFLLSTLRVAWARPGDSPRQVVAFTDALGSTVEISAPVRRIVTINGAYKTVSDGSGADKVLAQAGVQNIAAGQPVPWPEITAEWVVEQDPELIVKVASPTYIKTGYGIKNARAIDDFFAELTHRPAWQQMQAVRQGRVHILSSELWIGPRAPLGILYIAKWAYPERFKDIDPQAVHQQWLMKWHGKELKGIYVYP